VLHVKVEPKIVSPSAASIRFFKNFWQRLCIGLLLFSIPLLAFELYSFQLFKENRHTGVVDVQMALGDYLHYFFWIIIITALYPVKMKHPTEIFMALHLLIVCLCSSIYWKITGILNISDAILLMTLLVSPVFALKLSLQIPILNFQFNIKIPKPLTEKNLLFALLLILAAAVVTGYIINGNVAGFDLSSSYDRRLAARDTFADNVFARYLFDIAMNGVLPFFAFMAGKHRSLACATFVFIFSLVNFWLIGTKATFIYATLMIFVGLTCVNKKCKNLPIYFLLILLLVFFGAAVECLVMGKSLIVDYIIRRVFMVGSQIQIYYFDYIFNNQNTTDILATGIQSMRSPSFFIGEAYFNDPETNANTNAFLYALAFSGLPGILLCVIFICLFFRVLDQSYAKTGSDGTIAIVLLYTILLLEQAFTTAFISSGIFLCFLLNAATRTKA